MQEIINGGTNIKDKPAPMMANDPKALNDAFDKIEAKITDLLCDHVIVTDVLSENVKMVTNSETDTTPKKLVVTIKKNNEAGTIVAGPATSVTDEGYTITAKYDAAAKQITLDFPTNYTLNPDYTYIVTATIEATEKAYENVRANKGVYPNIGDAGTGDTSADQRGVYSNKDGEAKVSYVYNDSKETEYYNKPVIQLEPAKLIVKKTISGLESLSDDQIKALEKKMTFDITYTYPTGNPATVTETKKLSDFAKNDDGTYTYTSGDIWSMGAKYEVTETGYDAVTDYVCNPTATDAKGSIPKYSTATASFTNTYTKATQDLTITKKIVNLSPDAKFKLNTSDTTYTFTVTADADVDVAGNTYTIEGSKEKEVSFTDQVATVTIQGEGSIKIKDLPVGGYTVTEQESEDVTGYDFKGADYSTAGGKTTLTSNAPGTVTVTNKYEIKKIAVNVKKELTGNMYNSGDTFNFTATGCEKGFELGKDQTREFTVNYGTKFEVTETDDKGYTLESIRVDSGGDTGEQDGSRYTINSVTKPTTIIFTNKKQINPPNGITTTIAPYAIMVVLAAGAGVYFVYSRRRRNH